MHKDEVSSTFSTCGETRTECNILVTKTERMVPLGKCRGKWEDVIVCF